MALPKIRICDLQFAHNPECSFGAGDLKIKPSFFEWYRGHERQDNDIVVMTESCMKLVDMQTEKIKILLILEPPCISRYTYQWISKPENYQKFDYILTYNSELLELDKRFILYIFGGGWIRPEDRKVYPKTKNISIVVSWKKDTEGQKMRHRIIELFGDKIDVFGNGYKFVENKLEALKDYRYSIVIENERADNWHTEKILDCFATGTIPIYWGGSSILDHFNGDGIISDPHFDQLVFIISSIADKEHLMFKNAKNDYDTNAIENNFERAKEFYIPEDRIYQTFFKSVLGL